MKGRFEGPRSQGNLALSNSNAQTENAAQAVFRLTGKCLLANQSVERLSYIDPEKRQSEKTKYERHLLETLTT